MRKCLSGTGANSMLTGDQGAEGRADGSSPPPSSLLLPPLHQGLCGLELPVVWNLLDSAVVGLESVTLRAMQSLLIRTQNKSPGISDSWNLVLCGIVHSRHTHRGGRGRGQEKKTQRGYTTCRLSLGLP